MDVIEVITMLDVACGRPADPLRAKSLAFALSDVPPEWVAVGCRKLAQQKTSKDFPATAAEVYKAAWQAAGFVCKYRPEMAGDAAYLEPAMGSIRWWPKPGAKLSGCEKWDALPQGASRDSVLLAAGGDELERLVDGIGQ